MLNIKICIIIEITLMSKSLPLKLLATVDNIRTNTIKNAIFEFFEKMLLSY